MENVAYLFHNLNIATKQMNHNCVVVYILFSVFMSNQANDIRQVLSSSQVSSGQSSTRQDPWQRLLRSWCQLADTCLKYGFLTHDEPYNVEHASANFASRRQRLVLERLGNNADDPGQVLVVLAKNHRVVRFNEVTEVAINVQRLLVILPDR